MSILSVEITRTVLQLLKRLRREYVFLTDEIAPLEARVEALTQQRANIGQTLDFFEKAVQWGADKAVRDAAAQEPVSEPDPDVFLPSEHATVLGGGDS